MNVNRMKKRILLLLLVIPALLKAQDVMTETRQELTSPDGAYRFTFYQRAVGEDNVQMYYTLTYKNRPVIEESKLGVLIENQLFESALGVPNDTCHFWCENLKLTGTERRKADETWKPVYGERAEIRDCYNEMTLKFKKGEGDGVQDGGYDKRKNYFMNIIVRAYDEGVAFRYHFPETTNGLFLHIIGEQTSFTMPQGTMAYYERWAQGPYVLRPLEGWGKEESERPLTLKLPDGLSVALLEAEMVDYVRGKFRLSAEKPSTLETSLYSSVDIISSYSTPWRVIMVGERPVDLINNNDIVLNLNPACKLADTSWIKPGKVFRSGDLKQDRVKAAIDFAAERGIRYVHMDAGWYGPEMKVSSDATTVSPDKDLDIPALCQYAESKGIGLMVYVNQRALVQQLDTLLPLYKKWGLKGIKFGFVQIGNQRWSTWLHDAVRKCGEYGLMVDIHDEYRPTGFSRTYPNLMTQEGIRGNEEMPDATHNTVLPYTRFLAGAADYTLCYFNGRVKNTKAHQLAMAAVYYSPLQFMFWYDRPEFYKGEEELEFWKAIPSVWDDSRALDGEIGEYIVQARRSGNDWFVGAMTNTEARTVTLTTDFLELGKKYMLHLYEDDDKLDTRTKVRSTHKKIKAGDKLTLKLKASGGAALHFTPLK
ncbi:glycoside hydrolase family 97 protein [Bacteroides acidifaciens]|uniref:glycoside hydrolase family 97 protein n=1 Tax=Bacteroides acidifaciens TaxID=85831 RepID=UPI000468F48D|nr:glycoside hydrolase family 97 protein [Bacteroides acidifaciens]MCR1996619.1 glycoside hydrolase family 97 protein [Bacteroides acidifaciens]